MPFTSLQDPYMAMEAPRGGLRIKSKGNHSLYLSGNGGKWPITVVIFYLARSQSGFTNEI
jgi:hypothetical protein